MTIPNLLRHISLRHVRLQKAQMFMAMAGICLGVAAVISIGIINRSILDDLVISRLPLFTQNISRETS